MVEIDASVRAIPGVAGLLSEGAFKIEHAASPPVLAVGSHRFAGVWQPVSRPGMTTLGVFGTHQGAEATLMDRKLLFSVAEARAGHDEDEEDEEDEAGHVATSASV